MSGRTIYSFVPTGRPNIEVTAIDYHRNGVSGRGFHVVLFTEVIEGKPRTFLGIVPGRPEPGECFVLDADMVGEHNIAFGENSWRGDHYEEALIEAIKAHQRAEWERIIGKPYPGDDIEV